VKNFEALERQKILADEKLADFIKKYKTDVEVVQTQLFEKDEQMSCVMDELEQQRKLIAESNQSQEELTRLPVLQGTIDLLESDLAVRDTSIAQLKAEILILKESSSNAQLFADEINSLKLELQTAEDEKNVLFKQLELVNQNADNPDQSQAAQIDFLQSIIASNQEKLAVKDAEIAELEKLIIDGPKTGLEIAEEAAEYSNTRFYCDTCEIFDAHDTEKCPILANDTEKIHAKPDLKVFSMDDYDYDDDETF